MVKVYAWDLIARGLWERATLGLWFPLDGVRSGQVHPHFFEILSRERAQELFPGSLFDPATPREVEEWVNRR